MRFTLALALLVLPVTAFAQSLEPADPIPVHRCVQTREGVQCSPAQDGTGFAAADGYTRADHWDVAPSQQAMRAGHDGPYLTR